MFFFEATLTTDGGDAVTFTYQTSVDTIDGATAEIREMFPDASVGGVRRTRSPFVTA